MRGADEDHRVAVVTGASSGIGRRVARDLAARGWRVVAVARRERRLRSLLDEIDAGRAGHSFVVADVSDASQVAGLAACTRRCCRSCGSRRRRAS